MLKRSIPVLFLLLLAGTIFSAPARADYEVMLCAGGNRASEEPLLIQNLNSDQFIKDENCTSALGYPAGESKYLRLSTRGFGKVTTNFLSATWRAPDPLYFNGASLYTRQTGMQRGWRHEISGIRSGSDERRVFAFMCPLSCKGAAVNGFAVTDTFLKRSFSWPDEEKKFDQLEIRLRCVLSAGCDRSPASQVDVNSIILKAGDSAKPEVELTTSMDAGGYFRDSQRLEFASYDSGSGLASAWMMVDERKVFSTTYAAGCATTNVASKLYADDLTPCPDKLSDLVWFSTGDFSDGEHQLTACSSDFSGNETCTSKTALFLNTAPPRVTFKRRPARRSYVRKPVFVINASTSKTFDHLECKMDWKPAWRCGRVYRPGKLRIGRHKLRVVQVDVAGNRSQPAVYTWRILKKKKKKRPGKKRPGKNRSISLSAPAYQAG